LEGTGKDMRHIKLKTLEELNENQLREWFKVITQSEN
jgi:signal-transduction protein with cAMP-binding, CBS, and nucleotidyltransferase domain